MNINEIMKIIDGIINKVTKVNFLITYSIDITSQNIYL